MILINRGEGLGVSDFQSIFPFPVHNGSFAGSQWEELMISHSHDCNSWHDVGT